MIKIVASAILITFGHCQTGLPLWAILPLVLLIWFIFPPKKDAKQAWVLVLGDLGHSPRIMNQSLSLVAEDVTVTMFGYCESGLTREASEAIKRGKLSIVPILPVQLPFLPAGPIRYVIKVAVQICQLLLLLLPRLYFAKSRPAIFLVQNPPSIPSLVAAWLCCKLGDVKFAIDWHNYGYSIMTCQNQSRLLCQVAEHYERGLARTADVNFTVTQKMAAEIESFGADNVHVLYDKPHERFGRLDKTARDVLFDRLNEQIPALDKVKSGSAKLLMSSTSWTADEDFGVLLDALEIIEPQLNADLIVIITGKGPQKAMYNDKIAKLKFKRIEIVTPWLEADDYPLLLGSAVLGVSLHSSSSGCDLPMKVVDMFGAALPVLALYFDAIGELVQPGLNGDTFVSASELAGYLELYLVGPYGEAKLAKYRAYLIEERISWDEHWKVVARPQLC